MLIQGPMLQQSSCRNKQPTRRRDHWCMLTEIHVSVLLSRSPCERMPVCSSPYVWGGNAFAVNVAAASAAPKRRDPKSCPRLA